MAQRREASGYGKTPKHKPAKTKGVRNSGRPARGTGRRQAGGGER